MNYQFTLPFKMPSLNEYINECRTNRYQGAKIKRTYEEMIGWYIKPLPIIKTPIIAKFKWVEGNKKRDYDNVAFAKKFILDALVKCGKLKDDNRKYVTGFTDEFEKGDSFKVVVTLCEINVDR